MNEKKRVIHSFLSRLIKNQQGLEMVEYMLIAALVVVALIVGFKTIGKKLHEDQVKLCNTLEASNCPTN